jgi:hypothetical protein
MAAGQRTLFEYGNASLVIAAIAIIDAARTILFTIGRLLGGCSLAVRREPGSLH